MTEPIDPRLTEHLAAWREDSRRQPRPESRERARMAMLAALAPSPAGRRRWQLVFRPRFGHARLLVSTATVAAVVAVAAVGWNAPAGSPLFEVRAARQGVMLELPGSNDAVLHMQFAEQSLVDARARVNPAESLANARAELAGALTGLPADRGSELWARYDADEATLTAEEAQLEIEDRTPTPQPSEGEPPAESSGAETQAGPSESRDGAETTATPGDVGQPPSSPSRVGGDDRSGSPTPGATPELSRSDHAGAPAAAPPWGTD